MSAELGRVGCLRPDGPLAGTLTSPERTRHKTSLYSILRGTNQSRDMKPNAQAVLGVSACGRTRSDAASRRVPGTFHIDGSTDRFCLHHFNPVGTPGVGLTEIRTNFVLTSPLTICYKWMTEAISRLRGILRGKSMGCVRPVDDDVGIYLAIYSIQLCSRSYS
jgi:hypothetical protein